MQPYTLTLESQNYFFTKIRGKRKQRAAWDSNPRRVIK